MYGHLLYDQRLRNAGPSDFDCDYDSVNGVYDISIVAAGSSGGFTIHITGASGAVIRELEVKNTGGSGTVVEVNVMGADDDLARVISVKRNPMSSGEMWIGTIDTTDGIGAASSPYGEISVNKIGSLVTSGDITAAINVYGAFGESMSIDSISCGGSLLAVLDVSGGDVGIISVGEDFVSLSTTSVIQGDIDSIIVDGIFLAPISVDTVRRVDVGQFGVDNLFIAQLNAGQISGADAGVFIHGDWISGTIAVELGALTAPIEVDGCFGCLDDVAMLELDEYEDLQTQVVFNKANAGGTWGTAAKICFDKDDIGICDDAITEPYYTITGIDAGSIGLAPFHLHA